MVLNQRRQAVKEAILEMATVRWSVPETVHYSLRNESTDVAVGLVEYPGQSVTLEAGRIYQGLPYTHGIGNYHSFAQFLSESDESGVHTLNISSPVLNGGRNTARIGNSCSGAVQQAWSVVVSSVTPRPHREHGPKQGLSACGHLYQRPGDQ